MSTLIRVATFNVEHLDDKSDLRPTLAERIRTGHRQCLRRLSRFSASAASSSIVSAIDSSHSASSESLISLSCARSSVLTVSRAP